MAARGRSLKPAHLETIYRNGVQTAYMAGHARAFEASKGAFPFLMYDAINDSRTRPHHLALDGVIKPVGDAFWRTNFPPTGHRCRCSVRSLSASEARARGGVTQNVPAEGGADEGWGSDPREWGEALGELVRKRIAVCDAGNVTLARKIKGGAIHCLPVALPTAWRMLAAQYQALPLPEPKPVSASLLVDPEKHTPAQLEKMFLQAYGESGKAAWMEKIGVSLQPDHTPFTKQDGNWKIKKNRRAAYMLLFADMLKDPAMVRWIEGASNEPDVLSLLGQYRIRGELHHLTMSYKWTGKSWEGWTAYWVRPDVWEKLTTVGVPLWRREE